MSESGRHSEFARDYYRLIERLVAVHLERHVRPEDLQ